MNSYINEIRSRRELSIDMAIHMNIFTNNQITLFTFFTFIPKTGDTFHCIVLSKTDRRVVQSKKRSLQCRTNQVKGQVPKINQVKEYVSKNDQLQSIRIADNRFIK